MRIARKVRIGSSARSRGASNTTTRTMRMVRFFTLREKNHNSWRYALLPRTRSGHIRVVQAHAWWLCVVRCASSAFISIANHFFLQCFVLFRISKHCGGAKKNHNSWRYALLQDPFRPYSCSTSPCMVVVRRSLRVFGVYIDANHFFLQCFVLFRISTMFL